jgi:hypothetical protein
LPESPSYFFHCCPKLSSFFNVTLNPEFFFNDALNTKFLFFNVCPKHQVFFFSNVALNTECFFLQFCPKHQFFVFNVALNTKFFFFQFCPKHRVFFNIALLKGAQIASNHYFFKNIYVLDYNLSREYCGFTCAEWDILVVSNKDFPNGKKVIPLTFSSHVP